MNRIKKSVSLTSLSMTPLIDVVFLLLIFFLVATRFEQEERQLDVDLPKASEAAPMIASQEELYIDISAKGEFFMEGKATEMARLEGVLRDAYRANPGRQRVTIRADKNAPTGHTVAAINACNKANIKNYNLAAE